MHLARRVRCMGMVCHELAPTIDYTNAGKRQGKQTQDASGLGVLPMGSQVLVVCPVRLGSSRQPRQTLQHGARWFAMCSTCTIKAAGTTAKQQGKYKSGNKCNSFDT